jgi:hypothetical protein
MTTLHEQLDEAIASERSPAVRDLLQRLRRLNLPIDEIGTLMSLVVAAARGASAKELQAELSRSGLNDREQSRVLSSFIHFWRNE